MYDYKLKAFQLSPDPKCSYFNEMHYEIEYYSGAHTHTHANERAHTEVSLHDLLAKSSQSLCDCARGTEGGLKGRL